MKNLYEKHVFIFFVVIFSVSDGFSESSGKTKPESIISTSAFDEDLYKNVLDKELCKEQLEYLSNHTLLRLQFADAGFRFPRGIFTLNFEDWGNYHQCLRIEQVIQDSTIKGKFCTIEVPVSENQILMPDTLEQVNLIDIVDIDATMKLMEYQSFKNELILTTGDLRDSGSSHDLALTLGMCIPKVCTTREFIEYQEQNLPFTKLQSDELFCRLPNDKPFTAGDIVAVVLLTIFGILLIISTSYDLYCVFITKQDPSQINKLFVSCSVYTNTKKLVTSNTTSNTLDCIDGLRSLAIIWIIVGHTLSSSLGNAANPIDVIEWINDFRSVWLLSVPLSVDTFFLLSGLLLVYTNVVKYNRGNFIRNLPFFYLLRYLRIFPLLAIVVLLQASLFNHVSDGPMWASNAVQVESCRTYWWSTLLHVQNYVNPLTPCIGILWYLSVDMQLHWISPLVLFWVLSKSRRKAWWALSIGLAVALIVGTLLSFFRQLPGAPISLSRPDELDAYMTQYYVNTLTRASPFFVGMIFGYLLHLCSGKRIILSPIIVTLCWCLAVAASSFVFFITHPISRSDYNNQILDSFLNSFKRPMWAAAIGWLIFACAHGYADAINWFLSLRMWKLPAKLSFAMYVLHYPIMFIFQGTLVSPLYFAIGGIVYRFLSDLTLTFLASITLTIAIELPFFNVRKLILADR